ncbi:hypothetical protein Ahy_A05g023943 [Arachis hypogaea]|uniref:Protein FAR1-RELATED SEQUENCE n=1 Tax=Arachis hypogaea TaxID=3818 RepID=A0A445D4X9_ARAHY|nr:hypothetical protein Ahy_A05g023943 [Arachis hypogaea]
MDDSTSDYQLNQSEVDFEIESNEVPEFVPKVGMTCNTVEDAAKFYNNYAKVAESFDRNWDDFLLKYGLVDNKWLSDLYEDCHIWNNSLIQFVKQYDNCLGSREQTERESDAADFHTVVSYATKSSIEAQFQHVYTHQKFRKVQAQFRGKANCITRLTNSALGYSVYEVGEQVFSSIFNKVYDYLQLSSSPSEMPVLIIRVKRDIVPSRPKLVKL